MADQDPFAQYATKDDPFAAYAARTGEAPPMGPRGTLPGMHTDAPRMSAEDPSDTVASVAQGLEGPAHPHTLGDMAAMFIPGSLGMAGATGVIGEFASRSKNALKAAAQDSSLRGLLKFPGRAYRAFEDALPSTNAREIAKFRGGADPVHAQQPPTINTARDIPLPAAAPAATPTASGLSATDRSGLTKQNYSPDVIAKIEQQMSGRLQMTPKESPLQQPRVNVGAEQVGRGQGLTKEQVRSQTAPILGEAQGEASPIFPQQTLGKIVDAVKALPSSEREAYVAKATSGKAQWQIENIRRTLEHLGLLVVATTGAGAIREQVKQRLAQ